MATEQEIIQEALRGLIAAREQLGFTLSYAQGLIDRADYETFMELYPLKRASIEDLKEKVLVLSTFIPVTTEIISAAFRVSVEDAEAALGVVVDLQGDREEARSEG